MYFFSIAVLEITHSPPAHYDSSLTLQAHFATQSPTQHSLQSPLHTLTLHTSTSHTRYTLHISRSHTPLTPSSSTHTIIPSSILSTKHVSSFSNNMTNITTSNATMRTGLLIGMGILLILIGLITLSLTLGYLFSPKKRKKK